MKEMTDEEVFGREMTDEEVFGKKKKYISASDDPSQVGLLKAVGSATEAMDKAFYGAGGAVTDFASRRGASPGMAAGLGYGANVTLQSIPMLFGGGSSAVPLKNIGRELMQMSLKPSKAARKSGDAAVAIDTMLEEGINVSRGGVEKLRGKVDDLNEQIKEAIANSPETVRKSAVGRRLVDTLRQFREQVNPLADMEAIKKAWSEFRNHPDLIGREEIPVQLAQSMKQGTYRQLNKKYGQMGIADVEAQKGLARGLKEEIAQKIPGISELNSKESNLIKALKANEERVLASGNNNLGGLAWLTTNPKAFAAFMADRSDLFKSLVARMIYSSAPAAGRAAIGGGVALSEIGQNFGP